MWASQRASEMIVGIFQSLVLLDRCGVGQMNSMSLVHQAVDQPVPVVGRLDDNALEPIPIARELLGDQWQIVGQPLLINHLILFIDQHRHVVIRVQIDRAVQFHLRLLLRH